jgi:hypothetical protein
MTASITLVAGLRDPVYVHGIATQVAQPAALQKVHQGGKRQWHYLAGLAPQKQSSNKVAAHADHMAKIRQCRTGGTKEHVSDLRQASLLHGARARILGQNP